MLAIIVGSSVLPLSFSIRMFSKSLILHQQSSGDVVDELFPRRCDQTLIFGQPSARTIHAVSISTKRQISSRSRNYCFNQNETTYSRRRYTLVVDGRHGNPPKFESGPACSNAFRSGRNFYCRACTSQVGTKTSSNCKNFYFDLMNLLFSPYRERYTYVHANVNEVRPVVQLLNYSHCQ